MDIDRANLDVLRFESTASSMNLFDRPLGPIDLASSSFEGFREIADLASDALAIVTDDLTILDANLAFANLLSIDRARLGGRPLPGILTESAPSAFTSPGEGGARPPAIVPAEIVTASGEAIAVGVSWSGITLAGRRRAVVKLTRARPEPAAVEAARPESQSDPLTGLLNRSALDATIRVEMSRAHRHGSDFAILCLDLDGFKAINDVYGHPVGDQVLRIVASRVAETIRDTDVAFRVGGDEFLIVQTHADQAGQSARLAERLIDAIGQPYIVDDFSLPLGVSIGIAHFPAHGDTVEDLLKRADAALYRAKREGKNTHRFFDPSMNDALQARRRMEIELRAAIDHGELSLAYQPQVDLATGQTSAFEALLRCDSPRFGGVSVSTFIGVAEEAGLIVAVGEWVIGQAFAEAATWPNALGVAINLSSLQIQSSTLLPTVRDMLAGCRLDPGRVVFEISEPTLMLNRDQALPVLTGLKALGVRIAVDDFGTGPSSLSYLHSFPFDILKIDRSFVATIDTDPRSAAIVKSLLLLSREIGLTVIAEGVETEAQRAVLNAQRCDLIQGYLVGRPDLIDTYRQATGRSAAAPEPRQTASTPVAYDLRGSLGVDAMSVLLADDSQVMGEMIALILRTMGFASVDVVRNGKAALEHLRAGRYALVISDWNMTPVNGIELLGAMREDPALSGIPFLMLTANGRTANRVTAREAGADAFLVKPFRPDTLAARIVDAVRGRGGPDIAAVA